MSKLLISCIFTAALLGSLHAGKDKRLEGLMPMPNVDYLACGYNQYFGNPHTDKTGADPGYQEKIFNFTYMSNRTTLDMRYLVPDQTTFRKNYGCHLDFETTSLDDV